MAAHARPATPEAPRVMDQRAGGVFAILVTPFDERERIDEQSLRRLVDYNIEAGVHGLGISYPGEIDKMTEGERAEVVTTVSEHADGRAPVVVNVSAPGIKLACAYAEDARRLGASAVMAMPPQPDLGADVVRTFYEAIAQAADLPIFLQSSGDRAIPAPLMRELAEEIGHVRFAKVDADPPVERVEAAVREAGELVTILGGASGRFFMEELRRGARGTTPWPSRPHAFVKVWNQWREGDADAAQATFDAEIAPLLTTRGLDHKEILRREGVIASSRWRSPGPPAPDAQARSELDAVCERLGIGRRA